MKTAITITGLLGKPNIISRRTAMAAAVVYGTDKKTTHRIQGFALGLLPQHLPVTVTGEQAEDGIISVKSLTLARPIDKDRYLDFWAEWKKYVEARRAYEEAMREYREDGGRKPREPKAPSSYKALTEEYDLWLRKLAKGKKGAQELWAMVECCLLDPAVEWWGREDKPIEDIPEAILAEALYPSPLPHYALTIWNQRPSRPSRPAGEPTKEEQERREHAEAIHRMEAALTAACAAWYRYNVLVQVFGGSGVNVSQAGLEYLQGPCLRDFGLLVNAGARYQDYEANPQHELYDRLFLDQRPGTVGEMLMGAGLSLAEICKLEAAHRIPRYSASLPAYIQYIQRGHMAGHTVIDSQVVLDNAQALVPKDLRNKITLNPLVALKACERSPRDNMARYGTAGTAHGEMMPDAERYANYGHVGLLSPVRAERTLARLIDRRRTARMPEPGYDPAAIAQASAGCSPDQVAALQTLLATACDIKVLTGGPGTGKTTTLRRYLDIYSRMHPGARIALCAPTGRAAQRMAEQTGRYASTVHRLLEIQPFAGKEMMPRYTEADPLPVDLLVCDEASMLTSELAAMLLAAVTISATVLLIGDADQLPAIGAGAVLRDLMALPDDCLPKARLTCQHRSGDVIGINARAVLSGRIQDGVYNTPQYRIFSVPAGQVLQTALTVSTGQVLAPKYAGDAGIDRLNEELRRMRNPGPTVRFGRYSYTAGDPVIFTRNAYESGYMNGDMGKIIAVTEAEMTVDLFGQRKVISKADSEDVRPAYCISVHKAQGSEADDITIVLPADARKMVTRSLLYTAITRAKRSVTIICEQTETGDSYADATRLQEPARMTLLPLLMAGRLGCRIDGDDVLGNDVPILERLRQHIEKTA